MLGAYGGDRVRRRRTSTASPRDACASTSTTAARCRACRRATTCSAARSTSCGGRGDRSRCGRSRSPRRCAAPASMTKLVTDHPHLFETGGENYHTDFTAWDYQRGHEGDPWQHAPRPVVDRRAVVRAAGHMPYDNSRGWFRDEDDFPGPRTMARGGALARRRSAGRTTASSCSSTSSIRTSRSTRPSRTRRCTTTTGTGPHLIWPPYTRRRRAQGRAHRAPGRQIRAQYGAKLTMIDALVRPACSTRSTRRAAGDDTAVIVCTDHGHYLGEKDIWGKPGVPDLRAARATCRCSSRGPGVDAGRRATRSRPTSTSRDARRPVRRRRAHRTHGRSLVPLLDGASDVGARVGAVPASGAARCTSSTDRREVRAARRRATNAPLSMWSNRWSTMPVHAHARSARCRCPTTAPCSTACRARRCR